MSLRVDLTHSAFPGRRWVELRLRGDLPIRDLKDKLFAHTGAKLSTVRILRCLCAAKKLCAALNLTLNSGTSPDSMRLSLVLPSAVAGQAPTVISLDGQANRTLWFVFVVRRTPRKGHSALHRRKDSDAGVSYRELGCTDSCELRIESSSCEGGTAIAAAAEAAVARGDMSGKYNMTDEEYDRREGTMRVALDEPLGTTDGRDVKTVVRRGAGLELMPYGPPLFECRGFKYGEFVLPEHCQVGDFPELNPLDLVDEI